MRFIKWRSEVKYTAKNYDNKRCSEHFCCHSFLSVELLIYSFCSSTIVFFGEEEEKIASFFGKSPNATERSKKNMRCIVQLLAGTA